jgi:hypothetical protein
MKFTPGQSESRYLATRTVSFYDDDAWREDVDLIDEKHYVESRVNRLPDGIRNFGSAWYQLQFGLHLLSRSRKYDGVVVGRYGIWFPILQRLLGMRKRVVMTDTEWRELNGGRLNRWAASSSIAVTSNTKIEIERYSRHYRIPPHKFRLVLLAYQQGDQRRATDEGYIFAGGFQGRDWETFLKAVDGLPFPVRVFTQAKLPYIPSNVTVALTDRRSFYDKMAAASCVVISLKPEPLRITGSTTWTNAMGMGKVVIVTDPEGAPDYIEQGVSGFHVAHGDVNALRETIRRVMMDAGLRAQIGEAARIRAEREFSPQVFRARLLSLMEENEVPACESTNT